MPPIISAYRQLEYFKEQGDVSAIWHRLCVLTFSSEADDEDIQILRTSLKAILSKDENEKIKSDDVSLSDAAYNALLALAEYSPINDKDPILQDQIDPDSRVFVSSGYQFDIKKLIEYHQSREFRAVLRETEDKKWLLNPFTNDKFSLRDAEHILRVAKQKDITIPIVRRHDADEGSVLFDAILSAHARITDDVHRVILLPFHYFSLYSSPLPFILRMLASIWHLMDPVPTITEITPGLREEDGPDIQRPSQVSIRLTRQ